MTGSPALRALSDPTTTLRGLQKVRGLSVIRAEKAPGFSERPEAQNKEVQAITITVASLNNDFNVILFMSVYLH